jgi:hypothetical protein
VDEYQSRIAVRAEHLLRRTDMQELRRLRSRSKKFQNIPFERVFPIPNVLIWPI